jgi:hypothetical protein
MELTGSGGKKLPFDKIEKSGTLLRYDVKGAGDSVHLDYLEE